MDKRRSVGHPEGVHRYVERRSLFIAKKLFYRKIECNEIFQPKTDF